MRASTAMNLGRAILKPLAGVHWDHNANAGCAWGMADAALGGGAAFHLMLQKANQHMVVLGCECGPGEIMLGGCQMHFWQGGIMSLAQAIVHLFNYHVMTKRDWSMDRLIEWVRSVE